MSEQVKGSSTDVLARSESQIEAALAELKAAEPDEFGEETLIEQALREAGSLWYIAYGTDV